MLWASRLQTDRDGRIHFFVINGHWEGSIKNGVVEVNETKSHFPGNRIAWKGTAPFRHWDYNEAMCWLNDKINRPFFVKLEEAVTDWVARLWDFRHYRIKLVAYKPTSPNNGKGKGDKGDNDYEDDIPF